MFIPSPENQCILCGRCLQVCPLFRAENREDLSPRSKGLFLRDLQEKDAHSRAGKKLAGLCLSCGRCKEACPQEIDIPELVSEIKECTPSWKKQIWKEINRGFPLLLPGLARAKASLPAPDKFRPYLRAISRSRPRPLFKIHADNRLKGQDFLIFPGCMAESAWPWLTESAAAVLKNSGANILSGRKWSCCGYSLMSAGLRERATKGLRKNILEWEKAGRPKIAVFCATCYQGLLRAAGPTRENAASEAFAQSIVYMPDLLSGLELAPLSQNLPDIYWHVPCHAPAKEHFSEPVQCLEKAGATVRVETDSCCGLGGSMLLEDAKLCSSVAEDFWAKAERMKDAPVVTSCSGCVLQLTATGPEDRRVMHWLELFQV
jgi:glycolate oxidase iron-sulfur subunit